MSNLSYIVDEEYLVNLRRKFHVCPEVSGKEEKTISMVIAELDKFGIPYKIVENGGLLGFINGNKPGKTIALRADMDALPVEESDINLLRKKIVVSENPGVAHMCGHDAHMAMLLASAKELVKMKDKINGTIILVFERGEEIGLGIAAILKAMEEYPIDAVWGIHVYASLKSGLISVDAGPRMSGAGGFTVTVKGKGCHGARPDQGIDPITTTAQIITNLNLIISRQKSPLETGVCTIGFIEGGKQGNIIPESVKFGGTIRFFNPQVGHDMMESLYRICNMVAEANHCTVEIAGTDADHLGFPVVNDAEISRIASESINKAIGKEHLSQCDPWMASESMAKYLKIYPGVLAFLGILNEELGTGEAHHNAKFDVDESVLKNGVASTIQFALDYLA